MDARWLFAPAVVAAVVLSACGGDGGAPPPSLAPAPAAPPPPAPAPAPIALPPLLADMPARISAATPFNADCTAVAASDTVFLNAEVEPHVAVNPRDPANWVAAWQQDRWSGGAASGLVAAVTFDGGATWTRSAVPFSRCAGGSAANGGDYARATDPWVSFGPDGTVFQMGLAVSGSAFGPAGVSAMLVSRSTDGGRTWGPHSTLIRDGSAFFNDKNTITADPTDARYVYAVWDRLAATGGGPTTFARSTDGGVTWEAARPIYDPGASSQTIGNVVVVLPNGTLVNFFTRLDLAANNATVATLNVLLSDDKGGSWSGPFKVADLLAVGARAPATGLPIRDGSTLGQIAVAPNGHLWAVWQDARFSNGTHDGIALARSTDGGRNWSAPQQVNSAPSAQVFTPNVHVAGNGTVGITYFDLRGDVPATGALETELVLARSADGVTWTEHRIGPTFDTTTAPFAGGYFLGDYHGLASADNVFVPVYVRTNPGEPSNRTDVFAVAARSLPSVPASASPAARALRAAPSAFRADAALRKRVHDNVVQFMERRIPGWGARFAAPPR